MTIQNKYILVVMLTVFILVFNQMVIQYYLYKKKNDAQIINIAGKQRMLSQQINLEINRFAYSESHQKDEQKKKVEQLFSEWQSNHYALLNGTGEKNLRTIDSEEAIAKLNLMSKNIDFIGHLLASNTLQTAVLEEIYSNQKSFLREMDKTVSIIEQRARNKLNFIIGMEIFFLLLSITIIFSEVKFIFLPFTQRLHTQNIELKLQNKRLIKYQESNNYLSKFSHIISHDLKAPMRVIVSFAQLLKRSFVKEEPKETQEEYLDFIMTSVKEMSVLIDDLSQFVSLEGSKLKLEKFKLNDLLEHIRLQLRNKIKEKNAITTFKNIPSDFVADKTKSKLIFQNLISNSIKYSKENTPPEIIVECTEKENDWEFRVIDNGIGIDAKHHQDIFEIFVKLSHQRKIDSSGVGLALVKKAIEKHQGDIEIESKLGEGTTFKFSFPKFNLP